MNVAIELVHIVSAIVFAAGYIAANVLTELAREAEDPAVRRVGIALSGWFGRWLVIPSAIVAGISGLLLAVALSYPLSARWIWLSGLLSLGVVGLAVALWRRLDERLEAAIAADDDAAALAILRDQRYVAIARAENVAVFVIVVLMVTRPL